MPDTPATPTSGAATAIDAMPQAPDPMSLLTDRERVAEHAHVLPDDLRERVLADRPFEMRSVDGPQNPFQPQEQPPNRMFWLRTSDRLPDDPALHRYLLAYASDFNFLNTSLRPHAVAWFSPKVQIASVDHVMWFHRPFRVDQWLLHVVDSPSASGGRGFVRGRIFSQDGALVASTAQEGLIRRRTKTSGGPK